MALVQSSEGVESTIDVGEAWARPLRSLLLNWIYRQEKWMNTLKSLNHWLFKFHPCPMINTWDWYLVVSTLEEDIHLEILILERFNRYKLISIARLVERKLGYVAQNKHSEERLLFAIMLTPTFQELGKQGFQPLSWIRSRPLTCRISEKGKRSWEKNWRATIWSTRHLSY